MCLENEMMMSFLEEYLLLAVFFISLLIFRSVNFFTVSCLTVSDDGHNDFFLASFHFFDS